MKYASNTDVSADRSRSEIEKTLQRYGATGFMYGWQDDRAVIGFVLNNRQIKFILQMPDRNSEEFQLTPTGRERKPAQIYAEWEQATRQRWRALNLAVKAKLEAVESGIATFEQEFLAHIVLPNGRTVGEEIMPNLTKAIESGKTPRLLPASFD
jgi:hypothetical protein